MKKIVLFGELMLRLKSPAKERLFQSPALEAVFGGSEANVAVSLALLGRTARFVTALPKNAIGNAAVSTVRSYNVEVVSVRKEGRMGLYFLEDGSCMRPSTVIYDRASSVFSLALPEDYDWKSIFSDCSHFHISGVTPAVSKFAADCAHCAVLKAREAGLTVSLDLNYRKNLWKYGSEARDRMPSLCKEIDVLIANEEDIQKCLGIPLFDFENPSDAYRDLCMRVKNEFPNLKYIAVTLRESHSADKNGWSAFLLGKNGFYESRRYEIDHIVERVGAGDAFAAGLIFALGEFLEENDGEKKALDFATAAGCLKHSVSGDFNLVSRDEIEFLMNGNASGRIQR